MNKNKKKKGKNFSKFILLIYKWCFQFTMNVLFKTNLDFVLHEIVKIQGFGAIFPVKITWENSLLFQSTYLFIFDRYIFFT